MTDAAFEEVVRLAAQLDPEQQNLLIYRLRVGQTRARGQMRARGHKGASPSTTLAADTSNPSRDELLRAAAALRQTPPRPSDHLLGKYANPNAPQMSAEVFHAQIFGLKSGEKQINKQVK